MMTCGNLDISFLGTCSMAWVSFIIILFMCMIARRQCDDGILAGTGFNTFGAFGFGLGANIIVTTLFGSARWSLLAGVLGIVIGGYVLGLVFDTTGGGSDGQ